VAAKPPNECRLAVHCHNFVCLKCGKWVNYLAKSPHKCKGNEAATNGNGSTVWKRKKTKNCPWCRNRIGYWDEKPWQEREARDEFHLRGHDTFVYMSQHPRPKASPRKLKKVRDRATNTAPTIT